jgi:hypothetical protein
MANKQSASQQVIRAVLTLIGERRDASVLGLSPGRLRGKKLRAALVEEFKGKCAYCGTKIQGKEDIDHLVPMNKTSVGLHMYGNLVLACRPCNSAKHGDSLDVFLEKYEIQNAKAVRARLMARAVKYGADLDTKAMRSFTASLYKEISELVEKRVLEAFKLLPKPSAQTKAAAVAIQRKLDYDFSDISALFPIGSRVVATKDGKTGKVVDYSLEGEKGKRKPYVKFLVTGSKKPITRSPNQIRKVTK